MTPNGQIAIPLDKAAIREPFLEIQTDWKVQTNRLKNFLRRLASAVSSPYQWLRVSLSTLKFTNS